MIPVKIQPRFKCDFCKYRSVKHRVALHEKRCYRNPDRFCDGCQNKGYTTEEPDPVNYPGLVQRIPCHHCSKFDPQQLKEIEEREAREKKQLEGIIKTVENLPF